VNTKLAFPNRHRVDLFSDLPPASLQALLAIGVRRRYPDGAVVQKRGDGVDNALIVLSGRLRSEAYTVDGGERITRWMERGEISGLSSVLGQAPTPVDLVATGATELLILPGRPLLDLLARDAAICLAMLRVLSLRVNELFSGLFASAESALQTRVWKAVQGLAIENGQAREGRLLLRISQGDLARAVGASRQRVNEALRQLQAEGKLRLGYRWMELLEAPTEAGFI
jgi:CRP/FNR family cyclic AMP-dependent transcriptional regulator